eukprot:scaffold78144_cov48-Phaeocystis_antarctica.AAC.2
MLAISCDLYCDRGTEIDKRYIYLLSQLHDERLRSVLSNTPRIAADRDDRAAGHPPTHSGLAGRTG